MIYAFWSLVSAFVFLKGRLETETQSVLCAAVFCFEWREDWEISLLAILFTLFFSIVYEF